MGVVTLPPSDVAAVVESATIPTVTFAVPPPTAVAVPPPPTVFPVATAAAGSLTASVQAYHPSIHCCPMAVSTMSMISVHAAKVPISHRPPLHITAVVDTSGSMNSDNKLTAVKAALRFVVASLSDEDLFSVVTFDENAKTVVGLTPVTGHANGRVQQQINAMTAQGRTNLSAGVQMAVGLMHGSRPTPVYPTPLRTAHHVPPPPLPAYMSHIPAHVAPPPMPAHLMHMASRKIPATVAPAVVPTTVPPFYVGITRVNAADNALLKIEATLPAYVSHIDITAPGQIGSLQWKNGSPAMAVWPTGPLTFAIAFAQLNFAPLSQTVELESGVATFLTIAPQMTAAPGPEVPSARVVRPVPMAKPKLPIQLMMLFTDGEANLGISDVNTLSRKCTEWMRASCPDATLIAFGFGASHNAKLLRQVATATQGTYYHVPTAADIPKLFGDCLGGFMSVAARKLVVTVQPANPFVTINGVQTTYQATYDATGTIKVALKDLFSEERRDMIVSLTVHPTALALNDSMPLFKVTVTSLDAVGASMEPIAITAATPVIATPYTGLPNTEVEEQIGRMAAAVAVEKATDLASLGNFEEARHVLTHARAKQVTTRSAYARCVDEDLKAMEFNLNASAWAREGCVAANAMQTQHAQQRCNVPTAASASYYQTAAKAAFGSKASAFAGY